MSVPIARQIACVQRELRLRRRVYPQWVDAKRMQQWEADAEIEAMAAVLETLEKVNDQGQKQLFGGISE